MPGYRANNIEDLKKGIIGSLSDNYKYKDEMELKKKLWFSNLENGGCDNICNFLFNDDGSIKEELLIKEQSDSYTDRLEKENTKLKNTIDEKNAVIAKREKRIKELDDFIAQLINSKGWRFLEKMRSIKGIFKSKK